MSTPTFTPRQTQGWQEAVTRLAEYGVSADPHHPDWTLNWHDEVRPGRGNYLDATWNDGEHFVQVLMEVYGSPTISVAALDWIHSDFDEECDCEPCAAERGRDEREDELANGGTL